jgi:hypothetical protein
MAYCSIGTAGSGKGTLAKQMKILYNDGYTTVEERRYMIPAVHQRILSTFKNILESVNEYKIKLSPEAQVWHYA